ncbi:hypothetical protein GCM10011428_26870 [Streptomyces violaceus]
MCLPQVRLRAAEPVRHTPVTSRPVEVDEDGLLVHPLLAAPPTLSLWRAPTDNDELGGMAGRWRDWGLDALTRKVVAVRRDPGRVAVVADHFCPGGTVRHEQVFTAVEGGLLVEESVELPEALDDVARVGSVFETVAGLNLLEWFGQGPWESYPGPGRGRARRPPRSAGGRAVHAVSAAAGERRAARRTAVHAVRAGTPPGWRCGWTGPARCP